MVSQLVMNDVYCVTSQTSGLYLAILFGTCSSGSDIVIPFFYRYLFLLSEQTQHFEHKRSFIFYNMFRSGHHQVE